MSDAADVLIEDSGFVRILTLRNPPRRNALTPELLRKLKAAIAPRNFRAFIVRGDGDRAFCSGYDLQSLEPVGEGALPDDLIGEVYAEIEAHPAPFIACLNGAAFGAGFELATACDFRIVASTAQLGMPPAKLGVVYAPEGLQRLARLVGFARAKLLFFTGRSFSAEEALRIGLVEQVESDAFAASRALADELSKNAPLAISGMKQLFGAIGRAGLTNDEREQFRKLRRAAFNSEDVKEGRAAFLEKRPPVFRGR